MNTLLQAARRGDLEACRRLLDAGASAEGSEQTRRPLLEAVLQGDVGITELLIERGADVNRPGLGVSRSVFHLAARYGNADMCRVLIGAGAELDRQDDYGWTALHMAAFEGHPGAVTVLLEAGAAVIFVGDIGKSPLHRAIDGDSIDACRALVAGGVSPATSYPEAPRDYLTPVQYAMILDNAEFVRFFVEQCGEPVEQVTLNGRTTEDLMRKSPAVAAYVRSLATQVALDRAFGDSDGKAPEAERRPNLSPL